jgi:hypothetical protein
MNGAGQMLQSRISPSRVRKLLVLFSVFLLVQMQVPSLRAATGDERGSTSSIKTTADYQLEASEPSAAKWFKVSAVLGPGLQDPSGNHAVNAASGQVLNGYAGALLLEFGNGIVSLESGVTYMRMPSVLRVQQGDSTIAQYESDANYVGIPAVLKLNYTESPLAKFYVKGGVVSAYLTSGRKLTDVVPGRSIELAPSDLLVEAGFGGSAPISESIGFLIDFSYLAGTKDIYLNSSRNQMAIVTTGLVFTL